MLNPGPKKSRTSKRKNDYDHESDDLKSAAFNGVRVMHEDALSQFIANVSKIPLLTVQEEQELGENRIKADSAKQKILLQLEEKNLTDDKRQKLETELSKCQDKIDQVVCTFMERNVRLALKIAGEFRYTGLEIEDLNAAAYGGLRRAAELFDPEKGGKFSTYASWWIKQGIHRYCANNGRTIRLPVHILDKISRLNQISRKLSQELSREPTEEELAEELGIGADKLRLLLSQKNARIVHLDSPIQEGDSGSNTIGSIIPDHNAVIPGNSVVSSDKLSLLRQTLSSLKPREREIIELRFGVNNGGEGMTLEEVGKKLSVTRERIRQIQNIALKKMRKRYKQLEVPPPAADGLGRINQDKS